VTDIEQRGEWLALLEAELARRAARTEREADESERQREAFIEELRQMAARIAATAHLHPVRTDDMSIAEMLACRFFLPEHLMPSGLLTEDQIWVEYEARKAR
jgi:hypothetical protein